MRILLPLVVLAVVAIPALAQNAAAYRQIVAQYPNIEPAESLRDSVAVYVRADSTAPIVRRFPRRGLVMAYKNEGEFVAAATVREGHIGYVYFRNIIRRSELTGQGNVRGVTETSPGVFVIEHDLSKSEAYRRLRLWAAQTYVSAQDVIQMDDPESGTLVLKGAHRTGALFAPDWTRYTLTLDVRDRRVRFTAATLADAGDAEGRQMQREFSRIRGEVIGLLRRPVDDDF